MMAHDMTPYHHDAGMTLYHCDVLAGLRNLPDESVQMCVTSPPYWMLRDYLTPGQLGLEPTPELYVATMVAVFREVRRVLQDDGVVFLNLGDSYWNGGGEKRDGGHGFVDGGKPKLDAAKGMLLQKPSSTELGLKPKDMVGIPWRVAFALQADGWWLRSDIIWAKPNPMPESVTDRPTKSHEYLFLLTKQARYYYDAAAISERADSGLDLGLLRGRSFSDPSRVAWHAKSITDRQEAGIDSRTAGTGTRNRRTVWTIATQPFSDWKETSRLVPVVSGDVFGDTMRITSPDCPVHADLPDSVPTVFRDERVADDLSGILDMRDRHVQERQAERAAIAQHHEPSFVEPNSDSLHYECLPPATGRSNQMSKTGHGLLTSQPCMPSAQSLGHTGHTSTQHEYAALDGNMHVSSTLEQACSDSCISVQTPDCTDGTETSYDSNPCTCQFYRIQTEKTSHFATFPPKLVEPCILAGSREGDTVLDPFIGSGTAALVARKHGRKAIGIDINADYLDMAIKRNAQQTLWIMEAAS